ncbi:uncharacterized protein LOC123885410 isoform X1 [Trifolium pratense]|uniref:uncharacterized protein LOC123885410 isoform X1 n=1 Tax=Trifolium pratense TaxID=57577 RepID=UPI001E691275|nr:uncharacterized protein LOC123885410 isoform X1 [Trifolium pratense]
MVVLSIAVQYYVHLKLNNDPGWKNIKKYSLSLATIQCLQWLMVAVYIVMFCYCFQVQCIVEIWTAEVVEYNVSYVYHSLFAYFDRDNLPLKGLAKFFKEYSDEEREHAIKYQLFM